MIRVIRDITFKKSNLMILAGKRAAEPTPDGGVSIPPGRAHGQSEYDQPHRQLSLHELSLHAPPKEGPAAIPNPGIYFSHSNCQNSENSVIRAGTSRRNIFWSPLLLCQRPCSDRACSDGAPNMEAACARVRLEGTFVKLSVTSCCCALIVRKNIALP